jgi:protein TonB
MVFSLRVVRQLFGCIFLCSISLSATAQKAQPSSEKVYQFVEQMPQLPGGGGAAAISAAIQQHLVYPPEALAAQVDGRVFVSFIVTTTGAVSQVKVVKSLVAACDAAAVQAVRQLPRFTPGRQKGRPVRVQFTVPITFSIEG